MIMSDVSLKPYSDTVYHNEDLKSLSRYRFDKVSDRSKLKQSVSRLVWWRVFANSRYIKVFVFKDFTSIQPLSYLFVIK